MLAPCSQDDRTARVRAGNLRPPGRSATTSPCRFCPAPRSVSWAPNGAGKSTLLRVMAGVEQPSNGEAHLAPDVTVGLLLQEPVLDDSKTVLGNVRLGVADIEALLARYTEIITHLAEDYRDELMAEMGSLQQQLDHHDAWDLDARLEQAMDALRCPPPDADVRELSDGGTSAGCVVPVALTAAGSAAAR